ncbi:hypothetical protein KSD_50050 [Ktedonobacter sp. SOSP1-85]|uniref:hypothetical protein n=1 Tax=Ktedonobacter sp. SOSP1-85 TaxID=2778367 RepID=UPI0019166F21|nr:hypothetical protein [Ktedonobacter sp. SOSP1-85]GHO77234.1 hypothetical protein KSD_50050 [Ktedonobacter sp. SOSP1-85]
MSSDTTPVHVPSSPLHQWSGSLILLFWFLLLSEAALRISTEQFLLPAEYLLVGLLLTGLGILLLVFYLLVRLSRTLLSGTLEHARREHPALEAVLQHRERQHITWIVEGFLFGISIGARGWLLSSPWAAVVSCALLGIDLLVLGVILRLNILVVVGCLFLTLTILIVGLFSPMWWVTSLLINGALLLWLALLVQGSVHRRLVWALCTYPSIVQVLINASEPAPCTKPHHSQEG